MILRMFRFLLLGGFAFGALAALLGHLPAPTGPDRAPPADARPALGQRSPPDIAAAIETPLGDALFRVWCSWTLRERLADRPEWTLPRVATLCLCLADRAREGASRHLPDLGRLDAVAAITTIEERFCRRR